MAGENGTESGAGTGQGGGGTGTGGNGGTGTPPQPPAGGTNPPSTSGTPGLSPDILPEQLRGKSEAEIRFTLNNLVSSLTATNQRNRELEDKLRNMGNGPGAAQSMPANDPPAPKKPAKPLEEWILENPEEALDYWAEQKFGTQVKRLNEIDQRIGMAEFESVAREVDDFDEVRDDVMELLKNSGAALTRSNVMGAYTMIVGQKALEERKRAHRAANNPENPANTPPQPEKKYNKTDLSEQIRTGLGLSEDDYYGKYHDAGALEIKVPR